MLVFDEMNNARPIQIYDNYVSFPKIDNFSKNFFNQSKYIYKGKLNTPKGELTKNWVIRDQLLFKSTLFGDDTDRALTKADGNWTYFAADLGYHSNKVSRKFDVLINILGADHSGYTKRIVAATKAISKNKVNFFEKLSSLVNYHEGPIATISYYIHSFLSEAISRNNFKVAISGTGADELFTGYYDHYLQHLSLLKGTECYERNLDNWKQYVLPNIRNPYLKDPEFYVNNPSNRDLIYEKNLNLEKYSIYKFNEQFKEIFFSKNLLKNRMMNELFYEVVPVILKHDDLNSMYYSIENRSPYLDKELLNFALTIPTHLLISKGYQKKILRDSCEGILTDKVRLKRRKMGFNASINSIVDLDKETIDYIFNKNSPVNEFVDTSKFKKDLDTINIPNHISKFIFSIVNTNLFLEKNF